MKYFVIKSGKTIDTVEWDGVSKWQYPYPHDNIIAEFDWSVEQYPYPAVESLVLEESIDKKIIVSDFMPAIEEFLQNKEETTLSEINQALSAYVGETS